MNLQSILKDKHKLIALIMAPFLAIGGYGLADLYMNSREDSTTFYQLVANGECRPLQDQCLIEGRGVTVNVKFNEQPQSGQPLSVTVTAMNKVNGIGLSLLSQGKESPPVGASHDPYRKIWTTFPILPTIDKDDLTLRLAVSEQTWTHLGEIPISLR